MTSPGELPAWRDSSRPTADRVRALLAELTLDEKVAQLYGVWVGASADGQPVAPRQSEMSDALDFDELVALGLGQLTRSFGSAPVEATAGATSLARAQEQIVAAGRFGIPAIAHEECLAGFMTWGATAYPMPIAWGASFDAGLVERMAARIGADMRSVGVLQGLAPVLDVVRDARWGRVEETIGEDPYLVGTIGSAYVRGLQSAGVVATLKHFVGYSASRAGRNFAPVSLGQRELADVLLPPFEQAIREGGARSVMNAYTDLDGVPVAASVELLTGMLRNELGFDGTVVADYFAIPFLQLQQGVAGSLEDAAAQAITAGIDVELPTRKAYGAPLLAAVTAGDVESALVDRAVERVLRQKIELGLLDPDWSAEPVGLAVGIDLDSAENRALARELAEESVVLVKNDGVLPLRDSARIALIGPNAHTPTAVLGCYSFAVHVGSQHPDVPPGIALPTLLDALVEELPSASVRSLEGTTIDGGERDGFAEAIELAHSSDVVVLALGDRAGMFGRGTSGEGCDVQSLTLPGAQQQLLDAALDSGTPVVLVLLAGRPYALGRAATEAAAIVQAFFPGQEGSGAIAGVLSGRVNPSGRLPVSIPLHPNVQPSTYLAPVLARKHDLSTSDPTAAFPFGHGVSFSAVAWSDLAVEADQVPVDGTISMSMTVTNQSGRQATEVVQLYLADPVASVVRPVQRLVGYLRIDLAVGEASRVAVSVPTDLAAFTGRDGRRIVEPGTLVIGFGRSSSNIPLSAIVTLTGATRVIGVDRALHARWSVASTG